MLTSRFCSIALAASLFALSAIPTRAAILQVNGGGNTPNGTLPDQNADLPAPPSVGALPQPGAPATNQGWSTWEVNLGRTLGSPPASDRRGAIQTFQTPGQKPNPARR